MRTPATSAAIIIAFISCFQAAPQAGKAITGQFYIEYTATLDRKTNNSVDRIRANDPDISFHPTFAKNPAARANGLVLVNVEEDLRQIARAELYLEIWGGHPGTANKRFFLNGRGPYPIGEVGTAADNCTYSYPTIPLEVSHLVSGLNALQFTCDRASSFWGHFIIDYASVRCWAKPDHPAIKEAGLTDFTASLESLGRAGALGDYESLWISYPQKFADKILSVDYLAQYEGFDDNGDGIDKDFHGFTHGGKYINHIGSSAKAPQFDVKWDTSMVPTQESVSLKAIVRFKGGLCYVIDALRGRPLEPGRPLVRMFKCSTLPAPFWSRAGKEVKAQIDLPLDIGSVKRAQLMVKVWDGGEGSIKHPFKINGHPYSITSGKASHDVVFTVAELDVTHLKPGANEITLLSDTEHHGIEILLPGPVIIARCQ